jgi:hypothetical protein
VQPGLVDEVCFAPGTRLEVERILDHELKRGKGRRPSLRSQIQWKHQPDPTWELASEAKCSSGVVDEFLDRASLVRSALCVNEDVDSLSGGGCGIQGTHMVSWC